MKSVVLGCLMAAVAGLSVAPASATEFVQNGDFTQTSAKTSQQSASDDGKSQYVSNWTTTGYNFIVFKDMGTVKDAIQSNDNGGIYFWGKYSDDANAKSNGFTGSNSIGGSGGNYLAADGAYGVGLIYQSITGLTVGSQYDLTFNWAAAQQHGFDGSTTENWTAFLGTSSNDYQSYTTTTVTNPEHGFTPWQKAGTTFTATGTSETLAFLAQGTPDGKPPFSLLDDVSLKEHKVQVAAVPEASTWAMMMIGFGMMGVGARRRRVQPRTA